MTPQISWLWMAGYVVVPVIFGYTFVLLAKLWLGQEIFWGPKFCLADIFQFWGFVIGLWLMFDVAARYA